MTCAQNLSVVLTEKLPSNLGCFELIAGRTALYQLDWKTDGTDITKINEAMELTQIPFGSKKHYEISDGQLQKC
jgi:hypothetical protein